MLTLRSHAHRVSAPFCSLHLPLLTPARRSPFTSLTNLSMLRTRIAHSAWPISCPPFSHPFSPVCQLANTSTLHRCKLSGSSEQHFKVMPCSDPPAPALPYQAQPPPSNSDTFKASVLLLLAAHQDSCHSVFLLLDPSLFLTQFISDTAHFDHHRELSVGSGHSQSLGEVCPRQRELFQLTAAHPKQGQK